MNTIHGEKEIKIEPGLEQGTTFKLEGFGVSKNYANQKPGDQYIRFSVKIPHLRELTHKEISLLEQLQAEFSSR